MSSKIYCLKFVQLLQTIINALLFCAQGMGVKAVNLVTEEVMGGPEVVVETGTHELVGDAAKNLDKGKFVVAWKQEDGRWKMHRDMFTTSAAAGK
jgi:ketosteroid isomerase-like protein